MSDTSSPPTFTLNNGGRLPGIGFGTWKAAPGTVGEAVRTALRVGYRHIDCAAVYQNEQEVGQALQQTLPQLGLQRRDLFITSKLWNTCHHPQRVREACEQTLRDLQCQYLDLYLVHWPFAWPFTGLPIRADNWRPSHKDGTLAFAHDVSLQDTWRAMESLVDAGLVRSIGVSNYGLVELHDLMSYARIPPAVNQIECYPLHAQHEHKAEAERLGLHIEAYAPLGSGASPVLQLPEVQAIAIRHQATAAQVCLAWNLQRGCTVLPKSVQPERIAQNFEAHRLRLDAPEMQQLDALDRALVACDMREYWQYPMPEPCTLPHLVREKL